MRELLTILFRALWPHHFRRQTIVWSLVLVGFDDADRPVQLQDREVDVRQPCQALLPDRGEEVVARDAFALHRAVVQPTLLDQQHRMTLQESSRPLAL